MAKIQIFIIAFYLGMRIEAFAEMYHKNFSVTVGAWDIFMAIVTTALLVYMGALLSKAFHNNY